MTRHIKLMRTWRTTGVITWSLLVERDIKAETMEEAADIFEELGDDGAFSESFTSRKQPHNFQVDDIEAEPLEGIA